MAISPEIVLPVRSGHRTFRLSTWFREAGQEIVIFVHGLACSKQNFGGAWEQFELRDRSLLALDLPGFGRSARPPDFPATLDAQARLLEAVIDAHALRRIHVVGHSMGGSVATLLRPRTLARLVSLVVVEPRLMRASCGLSGEAAALPFDRFADELLPRFRQRISMDPRAAFDVDRADPDTVHRCAQSLVRWTDNDVLLDRFLAVPCRKLFVYGANNGSLAEVQSLPPAITRAIPAAGHFVMHDNPAAFYAVLAGFLDERG